MQSAIPPPVSWQWSGTIYSAYSILSGLLVVNGTCGSCGLALCLDMTSLFIFFIFFTLLDSSSYFIHTDHTALGPRGLRTGTISSHHRSCSAARGSKRKRKVAMTHLVWIANDQRWSNESKSCLNLVPWCSTNCWNLLNWLQYVTVTCWTCILHPRCHGCAARAPVYFQPLQSNWASHSRPISSCRLLSESIKALQK